MARYNPNENTDDYFGNEYIDFNQFLLQHNIGAGTQFIGNNAPYDQQLDMNGTEQQLMNQMQYFPANGADYNPLMQQQQVSMFPLNDAHFDADLARNSNLLPTANEFVPNFAMPANDPQLFTTAYDMMQQQQALPSHLQMHQQYMDPNLLSYGLNQLLPEAFNSNANNNDNGFGRNDKAPADNIRSSERPEVAMLEALKAAQIDDTDRNANRTELNKAGGAIKKVRSVNSESLTENKSSKEQSGMSS